MSRNIAPSTLQDTAGASPAFTGRSIVLVGLMGAGKTSIGRRIAARLGLPFRDADTEIELAAGCTIPELFERLRRGSTSARASARVIRRLLAGAADGAGDRRRRVHADPADPRRRARPTAISVWLRVRPRHGAGAARLRRALAPPAAERGRPGATRMARPARRGDSPSYAEADISGGLRRGRSPDQHHPARCWTALSGVAHRRGAWPVQPGRGAVRGGGRREGLLARAGALLAPVLPQGRAVVVTDELGGRAATCPPCWTGWPPTGIVVRNGLRGSAGRGLQAPGRASAAWWTGCWRRRDGAAHGGDRAGRGRGGRRGRASRRRPCCGACRSCRCPRRCSAQVDSCVGGKTGINTARGQEPAGRVPSSRRPGAGRHGLVARHAAARASCAPATRRSRRPG